MPSLVGPALTENKFLAVSQPRITIDDQWVLRPWRPDDAPLVVEAFADPDIQRWNMHRMDDPGEAREWIEQWSAGWKAGDDAGWAVAHASDDTAAGHIALRAIRLRHARAELSGWGVPSARGMSMGAKATEALSRWAFDELGLHRLFLLHSVKNPASCRVAINGGYRLEGTIRGYLLHADGWHDMHMHARLSNDTA
ncbi:GNAT family N-acetyltransferase [Actinoplanes rectilineatus]|uniref:GNAT family N-acetyltransferase n=1 Tax=Actinoplanes rectilineatus TaxID=113571 RepID=UPI0005F2CBB6|nr:GNAT family N-acetyltransferase [Actinoplanes rectilineatus]